MHILFLIGIAYLVVAVPTMILVLGLCQASARAERLAENIEGNHNLDPAYCRCGAHVIGTPCYQDAS